MTKKWSKDYQKSLGGFLYSYIANVFMLLGKTTYSSKTLWEDKIIFLISEETEMQ